MNMNVSWRILWKVFSGNLWWELVLLEIDRNEIAFLSGDEMISMILFHIFVEY